MPEVKKFKVKCLKWKRREEKYKTVLGKEWKEIC